MLRRRVRLAPKPGSPVADAQQMSCSDSESQRSMTMARLGLAAERHDLTRVPPRQLASHVGVGCVRILELIPARHHWMLQSDRNGIPPLRALLMVDALKGGSLFSFLHGLCRAEDPIWQACPNFEPKDYLFFAPPVVIIHSRSYPSQNLREIWISQVAGPLADVEEHGRSALRDLLLGLGRGAWTGSAIFGSDRKRTAVDPSLWQHIDDSATSFRDWMRGKFILADGEYFAARFWPLSGIGIATAPLYLNKWCQIECLFTSDPSVVDSPEMQDALADDLMNGVYRADALDAATGDRYPVSAGAWSSSNRDTTYALPDVRIWPPDQPVC